MIIKTGAVWLFFARVVMFLLVIVVFFAGQNYFYSQTLFYYWGNYIVLLLYSSVLYLTCRIYGGFLFGRADLPDIITSWIICLAITNIIEYFQLSLQALALLPIPGFLAITAGQIIVIIPSSVFIDKLHYLLNPTHKTILIYGLNDKVDYYYDILSKHRRKFNVLGRISQESPDEEMTEYISGADSVFFLDVDENVRERLFDFCFRNNKRMYILPTFENVLLNSAEIMWISNTPMFSPRIPALDLGTCFIKRFIDIFISVIIILLTGWLMLLTAAAIRIYDRQPALYKQKRITRGGKVFTLYKLRSMRADAEADGIPRLSAKNDARVTPIGKFIRRSRIDELPQMFNILKGSMSLVGPRPERPEIAEAYSLIYPKFAYRTKVKAGLTGFAQVYGRYNTAPDEKLFLDIMYIEQFSIWLDVKLILQTIKLAFTPSSTEGVNEGETIASRVKREKVTDRRS